jgi:hypothetical protein
VVGGVRSGRVAVEEDGPRRTRAPRLPTAVGNRSTTAVELVRGPCSARGAGVP